MNNIPQNMKNGNNMQQNDARARKRRASNDGGLSTPHKCPEGFINLYPEGHLIKISKPKNGIIPQVGGGKRGKAKFSSASRRRLLHKTAKTDRKNIPILVTLTYPDQWPGDWKIWKKHLRNFAKRLFRRFPNAGAAWKLEPQKRGAPHFHLLVWGVQFSWLYAFVALNWYEIVGSGDIKHLSAGTRVEIARYSRGSKSYFAKYLGKNEGVWIEGVGRYWGFFGNIPWADSFQTQISYPVAVQMMRYQRRFMQHTVKVIKNDKGEKIKVITKPLKGRGYQSLSCIVEDPMRWAYLYQYTVQEMEK
jgi:hypothetical protein